MIVPEVTLGNLITIAVTVTSFIVASRRITASVTSAQAQNQMKIDMLWKEFSHRHDINGVPNK